MASILKINAASLSWAKTQNQALSDGQGHDTMNTKDMNETSSSEILSASSEDSYFRNIEIWSGAI